MNFVFLQKLAVFLFYVKKKRTNFSIEIEFG